MKFTKMHGCGNDYIYVNGINQDVNMNVDYIKAISDRHTGIGSDGMIVILKSDKADFKMRMFNADGSEGKMCGNGIRCFSKFVYDHHLTSKTTLKIETLAGIKTVYMHVENGKMQSARVDMGEPSFDCKQIPVESTLPKMIDVPFEVGNKMYQVTCISMGNPHCVTFVDQVNDLDLKEIGPLFEFDSRFKESVNTEFVEKVRDDYVKMRVWERGSGETMACGTGACAVGVTTMLQNPQIKKVTVELLGGCLEIEWDKKTNHIFMTGPATTVYDGEIK